ncbi:MAG: nitrophenyl compound nitroreductase subunit ArsF family protein [Bacteroidales bacterium]
MKKLITTTLILSGIALLFATASCNQKPASNEEGQATDTIGTVAEAPETEAETPTDLSANTRAPEAMEEKLKRTVPMIEVYNFHLTNRCPSCNAIENATTKTLERYFAEEVRQGRIKRSVVNVDEKANQKLAEKYQAFGAACFVTRIYEGKESTTDLTGPGFKFARNREEQFIEMMKNTIEEYLKP